MNVALSVRSANLSMYFQTFPFLLSATAPSNPPQVWMPLSPWRVRPPLLSWGGPSSYIFFLNVMWLNGSDTGLLLCVMAANGVCGSQSLGETDTSGALLEAMTKNPSIS